VTSEAEGRTAVELARSTVARAVQEGRRPSRASTGPAGPALPELFAEPRGVFVTLKEHPGGGLRGCIGYPVPVYPLGAAIVQVAAAAALEDPRFPPLTPAELEQVTVEVSILTVPEVITTPDPAGRAAEVVVGRDGLIVDGDGASGLLLPQVATEQGWDATRFLSETCRKAGLRPDAWRSARVSLRRFRAEIFREERPGGPVVRSRGD
jgi:uncharacterized protein (TIGR00296 family)